MPQEKTGDFHAMKWHPCRLVDQGLMTEAHFAYLGQIVEIHYAFNHDDVFRRIRNISTNKTDYYHSYVIWDKKLKGKSFGLVPSDESAWEECIAPKDTND